MSSSPSKLSSSPSKLEGAGGSVSRSLGECVRQFFPCYGGCHTTPSSSSSINGLRLSTVRTNSHYAFGLHHWSYLRRGVGYQLWCSPPPLNGQRPPGYLGLAVVANNGCLINRRPCSSAVCRRYTRSRRCSCRRTVCRSPCPPRCSSARLSLPWSTAGRSRRSPPSQLRC